MTESDFYYQSMLEANKQRAKGKPLTTEDLVILSTEIYKTSEQGAPIWEYREELIKLAAIAMRLATRS